MLHSRNNYIRKRERQKHLPPDLHQLVIAVSRESPSYPYKNEEYCHYFEAKPESWNSPVKNGLQHSNAFGYLNVEKSERTSPSAEKQRYAYCRDDNHIHIFREIEERKLHSAVFRLITCHKLGFSFGKVKGKSVCFRKGANQIEYKTQWL